MTTLTTPYAITGPISPRLDAVLSYWQDLRRGRAEMPFWDDIDLKAVRGLCREIVLLDVLSAPERFRLAIAELAMDADYRERIPGRFIDEVDLPPGLDLLRSQASATVECGRPTIYRHTPRTGSDVPYSRLLAPAWGEGQIRVLLGAVERGLRDDD